MISGIAKLVNETITYDEIGNPISAETYTEVFVTERAITRQEWSDAGRQGLNPAIELVTPFMNYSGQTQVEYNGERYSVYRTYRRYDDIELYLEKKGGTYGKAN